VIFVRATLGVRVVIAAALGLAVGVSGFTFVYAKGASYVSDDPGACANCHAMRGEYESWMASSHRNVARCNDCHVPHGIVPKYLTKASNGFRHALAFTTGRFPDSIQMFPKSRTVTNRACQTCHAPLVEALMEPHRDDGAFECLECHRTVGHRA
jgi:cytochrome c nitrite reductase small subunit